MAELRDASSTALLEDQKDLRLSAIGTKLVVGAYCGHAYYMLDWKRQIIDPFDATETQALAERYQRQIDVELPPPPPQES